MEHLNLEDAQQGGPPGGAQMPPPLGSGLPPQQSQQLPPQMFTTAAQLLDMTDSKLFKPVQRVKHEPSRAVSSTASALARKENQTHI